MKNRVLFITKEIPNKLTEGKFLITSVFYTLVFSLLFLSIYQPFSITTWFGFTPIETFGLSVLFFFLAVAVLVFCKLIFVEICNKHIIRFYHFILWSLLEFLVISLLYFGFTLFFNLTDDSIPAEKILGRTLFCTSFIFVIPYTIIYIYSNYLQTKNELALAISQMSENHSNNKKLINFRDASGVIRFSVDESAIMYIKSEGNYINIHYEKNGKLESHLMRMMIRTLEESCAGTALIRCHRSYMVNYQRIRSMNNDKHAALLTLENEEAPEIPVSKSFAKEISNILNNLQQNK